MVFFLRRFFSSAALQRDVVPFLSEEARTFPFCVAIHSTSYGSVPRPVCCAAGAGRRRGGTMSGSAGPYARRAR